MLVTDTKVLSNLQRSQKDAVMSQCAASWESMSGLKIEWRSLQASSEWKSQRLSSGGLLRKIARVLVTLLLCTTRCCGNHPTPSTLSTFRPTLLETVIQDIDTAQMPLSVGFQVASSLLTSGIFVSAAGDVNGDGHGDIIIGSPFETVGGLLNAGTAFVVFGSSSSFTENFNLATMATSQYTGFRIKGTAANDCMGAAVGAAGDINNDGVDDVMVADFSQSQAGCTYIIFGRVVALMNTFTDFFAADSGSFSGITIYGANPADYSGSAIGGLGDVNGDLIDDFIVGARYATPDNSRPSAGVSYVIYGSTSPETIVPLGVFSSSPTAGFRILGEATGDKCGSSVSGAGDVNGDGLMDIIVANAVATTATYNNVAYLIFGLSVVGGARGDVDLKNTPKGVTSFFCYFGYRDNHPSDVAVSNAGDVNGDGIGDVIIGEYGYDVSGDNGMRTDGGLAYVVYGRPYSTSVPDALLFDIQPGTISKGFLVLGAAAGDGCGWSVSAAGDVNNDGVDDVIIGARTASSSNGMATSGAAYVIFGRVGGLECIDLRTMQTSTTTGFRILGTTPGPFQSGYSVSGAGDVNGDGVDDLLIGAASYVIYGSNFIEAPTAAPTVLSTTVPTRRPTTQVVSNQDVWMGSAGLDKGFRIVGTTDNFAYSVRGAGDFNHDGLDDLVIGVPLATVGAMANAGMCAIIFGRASKFPSNFDLPSMVSGRYTGFRIHGGSANDQLGYSVSGAGDFNNDGVDDVIVGSNANGANGAGATIIVFGRAVTSEADAFVDIFLASYTLDPLKMVYFSGAAPGDYSGFAVSNLGDVNGDLIDDVLIGAKTASPDGNRINAGIVFVIYGTASPSTYSLNTVTAGSTKGFRILGEAAGDQCGAYLGGAGDINDDGLNDIIVGGVFAVSHGGNNLAYIIFGRNLPGARADVDLLNMPRGITTGFSIWGWRGSTAHIYAVSRAGDLNGDGIGDVMVGAYDADPVLSGVLRSDAGVAVVVYGRRFSTSIPVSDVSLYTISPADTSRGLIINGAAAGDLTGWSLAAAGDVNDDGIDDIIVGATSATSYLNIATTGVVTVIYGHVGGLPFIDLHTFVTGASTGFRILGTSGLHVGYAVSAAGDINNDGVDDLIVGSAAFVVYGGNFVPQPTSQPTRQPFARPSSQPSRQPSCQPSRQPTRQPSAQPSRQPSSQPSSRPSRQPSSCPTGQPSGQPTDQPSRLPSQQPSGQPSIQPSGQPSSQPSSQPSRQPSAQPSRQPTGQPTGQPSQKPTGQPSTQPSRQPSTQPSRKPSCQPSSQPSQRPSSQPTRQPTGQPSSQPSQKPTGQPSSQPSSQPSRSPSSQPTHQPSGLPSRQPTGQPSVQPSAQPSSRPSSQPSSTPSQQPSDQPTVQPSGVPSTQPSSEPSSQPTTQPSQAPSAQPSVQPTARPSTQPSQQPLSLPSCQPSVQPTSLPSSAPSAQPSAQPSVQPSEEPSGQPTMQPSKQPTAQPSAHPSARPSGIPSARPTTQPSSRPSSLPSSQPRALPTCQPSRQPSMQPSSVPSTQPSSSPTGEPSAQPSAAPSEQPTAQPTSGPSVQPSSCPSAQPSTAPSVQPSAEPTIQPSIQPLALPSSLPTSQPSAQPSARPSAQPSCQPSAQPTSEPTVSGEWATFVSTVVRLDVVVFVNDDVWACGGGTTGGGDAVCALANYITGAVFSHYRFGWEAVTSVIVPTDVSKVFVGGRITTASAASTTSAVARCEIEPAQLVCTMKSFLHTNFLGTSYSPLAERILYVGKWVDFATATMVDATGAAKEVNYYYTAACLTSIALLRAVSPPSFVGTFVAGTGVSGASIQRIIAGWIRVSTGDLIATSLAPVKGLILNSVDLVSSMALEIIGPDSFIGGAMELSVNAHSGMWGYVLRTNSMYRTVQYCVRYVPCDTSRRLLSMSGSPLSSVVRALTRVDRLLFIVVESANADNSTRVTVIKADTDMGNILQQATIWAQNASISCTDLTSAATLLDITCKVERRGAALQEAQLISFNRDLSFSYLPNGFVRNGAAIFVPQDIAFTATSLSTTKQTTTIATTESTIVVTNEMSTTHPTAPPSAIPSKQPSSAPSAQPSSSPTSFPSVSARPTSTPSTSGPTNTYKPTAAPTLRPTRSPTTAFTAHPSQRTTAPLTAQPTSTAPSAGPTLSPSTSPSRAPLVLPTTRPTTSTTDRPSAQTTAAPTAEITLPSEDGIDDSQRAGGTAPYVIAVSVTGSVLLVGLCAFLFYQRHEMRVKDVHTKFAKAVPRNGAAPSTWLDDDAPDILVLHSSSSGKSGNSDLGRLDTGGHVYTGKGANMDGYLTERVEESSELTSRRSTGPLHRSTRHSCPSGHSPSAEKASFNFSSGSDGGSADSSERSSSISSSVRSSVSSSSGSSSGSSSDDTFDKVMRARGESWYEFG